MQLATTAAVCAAEAVGSVHAAAGASAIRNEYKFRQQWFRDVHTMTHRLQLPSRYESAGALMLGAETDWGFFAFENMGQSGVTVSRSLSVCDVRQSCMYAGFA